jgi:hypothetical protein
MNTSYEVKPWNKANQPSFNGIHNPAKDVEDKEAWCKFGEEQEKDFLENHAKNYDLIIKKNKEKETNPYTHDIWTAFPSDLKTIRTPFYKAFELYGIESKYAITMNDKDVQRYKKYPYFILVFDIMYNDWMSDREVRITSLQHILQLISDNKAKKHILMNRINDTKGNGKANWVFDYRWFNKIEKNN